MARRAMRQTAHSQRYYTPPPVPQEPYPSRYAESSPSLRDWIASLTPMQQLGYGLIAVILISTAVLYCVGASTFFVRPMLAEHAVVTPTEVVRPTLPPTATPQPQPTTFIPLPKSGTLAPTPTQAPMPPREVFVVTPSYDPNMPTAVATSTAKATSTRKPTATVTPQ